jgi:RNA polymerase sigma factor (sigma-70 family)
MQDETLISGMKRGEKTSFQALVTLYQRDVYGFLRARLREHVASEELTRMVFRHFLDGLAQVKDSAEIRTLLLEIASVLLQKHGGHDSRRDGRGWLDVCQALDRELQSSNRPDPMIASAGLSEGLSSLGSSSRRALDLYYTANQSPAEIGRHLKRSESSTRSLMASARRALLRYLNPDSHRSV